VIALARQAQDDERLAFTSDLAAILDAADSTSLMLVGSAFCSLMTASRVRYRRPAVKRLVRAGLLVWRVEGEIAEITYAGRERVRLSRQRARNAARLRQLSEDMKAALRKEKS